MWALDEVTLCVAFGFHVDVYRASDLRFRERIIAFQGQFGIPWANVTFIILSEDKWKKVGAFKEDDEDDVVCKS